MPSGTFGQEEAGWLWDSCWLLGCAIGPVNGDTIRFRLHVRNNNRDRTPPLVTLKAVCGPGDQGEPVLTIMQPEED